MIRRCSSVLMSMLLLLSVAACNTPPHLAQSGNTSKNFQSWQDLRFANVVKQGTDYTCGAAALAILAKYYYGHDVPEATITETIKARYSEEKWAEREAMGLTLLDLKSGIEELGFKAQGVKLTMENLSDLRGPVIVHLDKGSMRHFSVLRGFDGDRVYLADPIGGNIRMPKYRFEQQWTGNALLVWTSGQSLPPVYPLQVSAKDTGLENWSARRALYKEPLATVPWPRAP
jgi:uncharacterized protein